MRSNNKESIASDAADIAEAGEISAFDRRYVRENTEQAAGSGQETAGGGLMSPAGDRMVETSGADLVADQPEYGEAAG